MGIFSKDTKTKAKSSPKKEKKEVQVKNVTVSASFDSSRVIKNPRITEKAANISDKNVYTFDVYPSATKVEIAKAVKDIYKVTPVKVNVMAIPTKRVFRQKHIGVKRGGRKAYVTLKNGDKIEFI
ncbi:MAG: 50S ribosomal protein L23 [Bacteroidetes bacterium]|nr:50S ribosomal protein L23 [Bacteroidota bacterium]